MECKLIYIVESDSLTLIFANKYLNVNQDLFRDCETDGSTAAIIFSRAKSTYENIYLHFWLRKQPQYVVMYVSQSVIS